MHIQWFPGHMTKAMRMMEEEIKLCDGVIYVLDARAPFACINRKLDKLFNGKPIVYVLNKSDLVDEKDLQKVISKFIEEGKTVVACSIGNNKNCKKIVELMTEKLSEKIERYKAKGVAKTVRVMVSGVPNTGKSTIINAICGNKRAETGDKAGVTRGKQWIKIGQIELLDTPGTMPPSFDNQTLASYLAYIGSINDDILDKEELCFNLLGFLKEKYPKELKEKYSLLNIDGEILEIYEEICKRRGFLMRGGDFDYERCANAVIDDLRKGRIGKVIFL